MIQQGKPVTRGTLYTVFNYTPYDELKRLGLKRHHRSAVRRTFPSTPDVGRDEVLPGSPSENELQRVISW